MREDEFKAQQEAIGQLNMRLGPKPFAECSPEEQVHRLRDELEDWKRVIGHMQQRLSMLEQHQHGDNGQMLVPFYSAQGVVGQLAGAGFNRLG